MMTLLLVCVASAGEPSVSARGQLARFAPSAGLEARWSGWWFARGRVLLFPGTPTGIDANWFAPTEGGVGRTGSLELALQPLPEVRVGGLTESHVWDPQTNDGATWVGPSLWIGGGQEALQTWARLAAHFPVAARIRPDSSPPRGPGGTTYRAVHLRPWGLDLGVEARFTRGPWVLDLEVGGRAYVSSRSERDAGYPSTPVVTPTAAIGFGVRPPPRD